MSPTAVTVQEEQPPHCRLCWDDDTERSLTDPLLQDVCQCQGSLAVIHKSCLTEWIKQQQAISVRRSRICEICKTPYKPAALQQLNLPPPGCEGDDSDRDYPGWVAIQRRRLRRLVLRIIHAAERRSIWYLAYECWGLCMLGIGVYRAVQGGKTGFKAGVRLGSSLVKEQSNAVVTLLAAVADMLGTPAAEVLWIQVVAGVAFALASEFLYSVLLGSVCGAALGFGSGYVGAVRASFQFLFKGSSHLFAFSCKAGMKALRLVAGGGQAIRGILQGLALQLVK